MSLQKPPTLGQGAIRVPLVDAEFCGQRNPATGKPCRRAHGHTGRHAWIWRFADPGKVREVWH